MNNKFVYISIVLLLWQCAKSSNWYDITIVREDNSFVSYYDSISFTKETPRNIRELCSVRYEQDDSERNQIFEVSFNDLNIYVIRYSGIGFEFYDIWAYNPKIDKLSASPFTINGKWVVDNEAGFDKSILDGYLLVFSGDNIILRERVHNGNSYNAVVLYNLKCNNQLEFELQYCIEECSLCHLPTMALGEDLTIRRKLNNQHVYCYLEKENTEMQLIGYYKLASNGIINSINVIDNEFETWIVTTSGIDPQMFSKQGSSCYAKSENEKNKRNY